MILGVDTSNYTTSMCLLDDEGRVLFEGNQLLKVKSGGRGLRQSDAFFQHVHELAAQYERLVAKFDPLNIDRIAVSNQPRYMEDSYMPVFNAGVLFCQNLAHTIRKPLDCFSHQEGHLMAALKTCGISELPQQFYGFHLSGGTTEILMCRFNDGRIVTECVGGTLDLNMGQLIDRIGVLLGLDFPCGKAMDLLAQKSVSDYAIRIKRRSDLSFNISGLENKLLGLIETQTKEDVCRILFNTLARILGEMIVKLPPTMPVVMSGGVASNAIIRQKLIQSVEIHSLYFSKPKYSRDNAYGIAALSWMRGGASHC
ncbi:MAG: hypothetical protein PWP38_466 [Clostridiales bacterium]|jgi:N6-L-threonylcarbamoyladenine synthase|nr:hypothetical protein [Clostridiales bacterium]